MLPLLEHPPHSPDSGLLDFHIFETKLILSAKRFKNDEAVKETDATNIKILMMKSRKIFKIYFPIHFTVINKDDLTQLRDGSDIENDPRMSGYASN